MRPSSTGETGPAWDNVSANISEASLFNPGSPSLPTNVGGSEMAYDPVMHSVILWVGCSSTVCPDDETWEYNGSGWLNLTGNLGGAPSAREFPGFDFDPALRGVVLVGGFGSGATASGETWLFDGAWTNLTSTVGPIPNPMGVPLGAGVAGNPMAWDPTLQGMVMADGCTVLVCGANGVSLTWLLSATGWHVIDFGPGDGSGTVVAFGSMAFDVADGYLVFFGGHDLGIESSENWTFTYAPVAGWVNRTGNDSACMVVCDGTPPGREGAVMTWDGGVGAILMVGGYNSTSGALYNDSWEFSGGDWYPAGAFGPRPPAAFVPVAFAAMGPNSTAISPFLVGGRTTAGGSSNEWVWENSPRPVVEQVAPDPVDAHATTVVNVSFSPNTGSGPTVSTLVSFGDGTLSYFATSAIDVSLPPSLVARHAYSAPGHFPVDIHESDFFTVAGRSGVANVTVVSNLAATLNLRPTALDAGQAVTFRSDPSNGTAPYMYAWEFGDGTGGPLGPAPTHVYPAGGSFDAQVTVTDAGGGRVALSHVILVYPTLSVTASANATSIPAGAPLNFSAAAGGGSGVYAYSWGFGDGTPGSTLRYAHHAYESLGTFSVTLSVRDSLGSSVTTSLRVTVTPSSPDPGVGGPVLAEMGGAWLLLVLAAILGGSSAVVLRWNRRRTEFSPAPRALPSQSPSPSVAAEGARTTLEERPSPNQP
ncbi:MAG: PKD domain-containing protein [Thermoplasmata archaeon]|nr:PKD domain-containing protein [Thermoplasmata archaeon]